jgi:hypothetical protein
VSRFGDHFAFWGAKVGGYYPSATKSFKDLCGEGYVLLMMLDDALLMSGTRHTGADKLATGE